MTIIQLFPQTDTHTCVTEDCDEPTSGKSKYCAEHKKVARRRFVAWCQAVSEAKAAGEVAPTLVEFAERWEG